VQQFLHNLLDFLLLIKRIAVGPNRYRLGPWLEGNRVILHPFRWQARRFPENIDKTLENLGHRRGNFLLAQ